MLSRRDGMIVARQELPGKPQREIPSRWDGMISVPAGFSPSENLGYTLANIRPYLRHGTGCYAISRQFLPGYYHSVPPGRTFHLSLLTFHFSLLTFVPWPTSWAMRIKYSTIGLRLLRIRAAQ